MRIAAILTCLLWQPAAAFSTEALFPAEDAAPGPPGRVAAFRPEEHPIGTPAPLFDADWARVRGESFPDAPPTWTFLPDDLLYRSYVAGVKEPRFGTVWQYDVDNGWWWDATLGGRVGIWRYDPGWRGPGIWQLDIEGAALVRLDMQNSEDLHGVDFRFGIPLTWRDGPLAVKAGYYHISSHLGDEFLIRNPGFERINYVRESLVFGVSRDIGREWRAYGEIGYAFKVSGGAKPFEFQFGLEYDAPTEEWRFAAPFAAVNVHLRQELDYGGNVNMMTGWRWTGSQTPHTWRAGLQLFHGKSAQYSFFRQTETLLGLGLWYDY